MFPFLELSPHLRSKRSWVVFEIVNFYFADGAVDNAAFLPEFDTAGWRKVSSLESGIVFLTVLRVLSWAVQNMWCLEITGIVFIVAYVHIVWASNCCIGGSCSLNIIALPVASVLLGKKVQTLKPLVHWYPWTLLSFRKKKELKTKQNGTGNTDIHSPSTV